MTFVSLQSSSVHLMGLRHTCSVSLQTSLCSLWLLMKEKIKMQKLLSQKEKGPLVILTHHSHRKRPHSQGECTRTCSSSSCSRPLCAWSPSCQKRTGRRRCCSWRRSSACHRRSCWCWPAVFCQSGGEKKKREPRFRRLRFPVTPQQLRHQDRSSILPARELSLLSPTCPPFSSQNCVSWRQAALQDSWPTARRGRTGRGRSTQSTGRLQSLRWRGTVKTVTNASKPGWISALVRLHPCEFTHSCHHQALSHFPFCSRNMHPETKISLWEMGLNLDPAGIFKFISHVEEIQKHDVSLYPPE